MRVIGITTALALALAACSGDDGGPGGPAENDRTVATIQVTPSNPSVDEGGTVALGATAKNAAGATVDGITFTWSSADPAVASAAQATGVVTGVAAGTTTVSATGGGKTGSTTVTVTSSAVTTTAALAYARGGDIRLVDADGGNDRAVWTTPSPQNGYAVSGLSWKPDGTEIAFASDHEQAVSLFNWDIFAVRPDGSGLRKLTNAPAHDELAGYPQGAVTVRVSNIGMADAGPYFIYVLGAEEPQTALIPAGESVTLTFPKVADLGVPQLVVAVLPLAGYRWYDVGAAANVQPGQTADAGTLLLSFGGALESFGAVGPAWRSDGAKVAYLEASSCILHQTPASPPLGSTFDHLLDPDAFTPCAYDYAPASVGASQLLIAQLDDESNVDILRVAEGSSTAGQPDVTYPLSERFVRDLRWLPDGSGFLFAKQTALLDESVNLFEHLFATGQTRQITTLSGEHVRAFSVSPDGQLVAFERAATLDGPSAIWVMRRDGTQARLLVQNGTSPAWNPSPR